jgi:hypothetical protein
MCWDGVFYRQYTFWQLHLDEGGSVLMAEINSSIMLLFEELPKEL